jgi:hypothetical protein
MTPKCAPPDPMRILLAQNSPYFPSFGGGNKDDRILMTALARRGHTCMAVTRMQDSTRQDPRAYLTALADRSVAPVKVENGSVMYTLDGVQVRAPLNGNIRNCFSQSSTGFRPDLIIISTDPLNLLICDALGRRNTSKIIYFVRTTMLLPFGPESALPSQIKTEAIGCADAVVAVSDYLARYVRDHSNLPAVHLPIQLIEPQEWEELGSFDNSFVTMVNPCALKGIIIFLGLADALPNCRFAAVPTWGTTSEDLAELAKRPNVQILEQTDDIRNILRKTRVMLVPSLWAEGRGRIVVEAMLSGVPVLASDRGGIGEAAMGGAQLFTVNPIVRYSDHFDEHCIRAAIVPAQHIQPWQSTLERLVTDRNYYAAVSKQARACALGYAKGLDVVPFENFAASLVKPDRPAAV